MTPTRMANSMSKKKQPPRLISASGRLEASMRVRWDTVHVFLEGVAVPTLLVTLRRQAAAVFLRHLLPAAVASTVSVRVVRNITTAQLRLRKPPQHQLSKFILRSIKVSIPGLSIRAARLFVFLAEFFFAPSPSL